MKLKKVLAAALTVLIAGQVILPASAETAAAEAVGTVYDPSVVQDNAYIGKAIYPATMIDDFNSDDNWTAGDNAASTAIVDSTANGPGTPFEGAKCLELTPQKVKCYTWRSVTRDFSASPLDLSDANFLSVAANVWGWKDNDFYLRVTLTDGADTFTATAPIAQNSWTAVYFDIRGCSFKDSITNITFSYMKNFNLSGLTDSDPGYAYWDGRLQLDDLCATVAADLGFTVPGCTEGFAVSNDGSAAVQNSDDTGTLEFTAAGGGSTLTSPVLNVDASTWNIVRLTGTSAASAKRIKMQWITGDDGTWDDAKSVTEDLPADFSSGLDFNAGAVPGWEGTVTAVRFSLPDGAAGDAVSVDQVSTSYAKVETYTYAGSVSSCVVNDDKTAVVLKGALDADAVPDAESVSVYELPLYADELASDYGSAAALDTVTEGLSSFTLSIPLSSLTDVDNKFVVTVQKTDGSTQLVDYPKYVTNPGVLSENREAYPQARSIKGLQVQLTSDAERLGVQHAAINIAYNQLLTVSDHGSGSIPYAYEGQTYYFRKDVVNGIDNQIKSLTNNNTLVYGILIFYATGLDDADSPNRYIIHPNAFSGGTVYAVNLTDETGVRYYKAITSFLAQRYSRPDKAYGRLDGYIVGNEVGENSTWNDAGPMLVDQYVQEYERQLRLTNAVVKQAWANARVYISLDHFWNMGNSPVSTSIYDNKVIVDLLNRNSVRGGNFDWNVAFHPYPEDLFNPRFWNDPDATDSFDTYCITFKNLQVLTDYLQQPDYLYDGKTRHVILSEQGFHSGDNSASAQKLQAACYAYAYYKTASLPIDAFILHRHVDHMGEGGLMLGLWTDLAGHTCDAGTQKAVYNVFQNIDTVNSFETSRFALSVIGDDMGETVTDWSQIIPEFDSGKIAAELNRPAQVSVPAGRPADAGGRTVLGDFENGADHWYPTDNVSGETVAADAGNGSNVLSAPVSGSNIKDFKGVTYMPVSPADLSSTPIVMVDVKAAGVGAGKKAEYLVRVYSGDQVAEGSFIGAADAWNSVAVDLTGFAGLSSVDRVKVWARPVDDVNWTSGSVSVDNLAVASAASLQNLSVTLDRSKVTKVGDVVNVTVVNNGNTALDGAAAVSGTNGLAVDISSYDIGGLAPGASVTFPVTVTAMDIPASQTGGLSVTVAGQKFAFDITDTFFPDYTMEGEDMVFGDFESGLTDGWVKGQNTGSISSVQKNWNNFPGAANHGSYMLDAVKDASKTADTESDVVKTFSRPLDLSAYGGIKFSFFGWAGTSSSYTARITITAADGAKKTLDTTYGGNTWQTISADLSDFAGRDQITSIAIGYFGNDLKYYSGGWSGEFMVDNVRAISAPKPTALIADKSSETIALDGGSMQLVLRQSMSDGTARLAGTAASGTVYGGYDENIVSVSADGLVTPVAAGITTVTAANGGFTAAVDVTVAAGLPKTLYNFENGAEGWAAEDSSIATAGAELSQGGATPLAGYPKAVNGGGFLRVAMAGIDPGVRKMVRVDSDISLAYAASFNYSIYSWGGVPAASGKTVEYDTIVRLTGDNGVTVEKVIPFTTDGWKSVSVDLTAADFAGMSRIVRVEIGEALRNYGIPAWAGNFFIDNVTLSIDQAAVAADRTAAATVVRKISHIPDPINALERWLVICDRKSYDALTPAQQAFVTNYDVLTAAEAKFAAADAVSEQIANLPKSVTLKDEAQINAAAEAFHALTTEEKYLVYNYPILVYDQFLIGIEKWRSQGT